MRSGDDTYSELEAGRFGVTAFLLRRTSFASVAADASSSFLILAAVPLAVAVVAAEASLSVSVSSFLGATAVLFAPVAAAEPLREAGVRLGLAGAVGLTSTSSPSSDAAAAAAAVFFLAGARRFFAGFSASSSSAAAGVSPLAAASASFSALVLRPRFFGVAVGVFGVAGVAGTSGREFREYVKVSRVLEGGSEWRGK